MSGAYARRDVFNIRAIREGRALPPGNSQANAAALVLSGKGVENLEQEDPNAQPRVRECPRGSSRAQQAEHISSAMFQRQMTTGRVVQDCEQQLAELHELKEREERLLQSEAERLHKLQAELETQQPPTTSVTSSQTMQPLIDKCS